LKITHGMRGDMQKTPAWKRRMTTANPQNASY
jgi:hypothetical protein